jgi:hypothetical protein
MTTDPVLTVDVAHPPRSAETVEAQLEDAVQRTRTTPGKHILKIVHGYGSKGRGGSTREVVLNWLYQHRRRLRVVIEGPAYKILDPTTQKLRQSVGQYPDTDLDAANPGITIVWVR